MAAFAISVLMAYRDRLPQLRNTLQSYQHWYGESLDGIQLVIIDDTPTDAAELPRLFGALGIQRETHHIRVIHREGAHNPGTLYNLAGSLAEAPLVALTNPENLHLGPVLHHACAEWTPQRYLVYACRSLNRIPDDWQDVCRDPDRYHASWYQHSQHSARNLHFMSVMATEDFRRIGFDPAYDEGHGFEDNDLLRQLQEAQLHVIPIDEPMVAHQPHAHYWQPDLTERNRVVYAQKWQR